ncbi:DUF397 domain-containing protein [Streptomyces roseochromogenus]|uniref:DUF397 domain-containing protein n=1 Tax=Streptomyces roseochromogenus subsp. oscitans DS 12.976 TaxID=1352936 RepID=V6K9N2_STRRC|nr:DUF397 domain-containing protein [Streptomyces roseochromogenus]EST28136.1 hypothetical protein M878_23105 [Streptomyces roseochromogenus subsp. oscitans DS 12.976]
MPILRWRKSTYSPDGSNCVEIATTPSAVRIRDSKNSTGPQLMVTPHAWAHFLPFATEA